jgi:hypothetical protein
MTALAHRIDRQLILSPIEEEDYDEREAINDDGKVSKHH